MMGIPTAMFTPHLRDRAHHRLGRARHRAAPRRQDHPPERQLHRPRAPAVRRRSSSAADGGRGVSPCGTSPTPTCARRDPELVDIADYVARRAHRQPRGLRDGALLPDGHAWPAPCWRCASPPAPGSSGPIVPGTMVPGGARVPGTGFRARPGQGRLRHRRHGALAGLQRHLAGRRVGPSLRQPGRRSSPWPTGSAARGRAAGQAPLTVRDVLTAMIKAHEIQGVLALENSFNRVGLDHVLLVKVASTAVATGLLGGSEAQVVDALSHAWVDGQSLRTYRHAPNTGSRKSWAAGDATSRAVRLALMVMRGETGLPSALTAPTWGFCDVLFRGRPARVSRAPTARYVMENDPLQDLLPRRVPRPDRGRVRAAAAPAGARTASTRSSGSSCARRSRPSASSARRGPLAQPGRPRPLPAVHGRGAADLRRARRRRTTRTAAPATRASTRCARR